MCYVNGTWLNPKSVHNIFHFSRPIFPANFGRTQYYMSLKAFDFWCTNILYVSWCLWMLSMCSAYNCHRWLLSWCVNTRKEPPETQATNAGWKKKSQCLACSVGHNYQTPHWLVSHVALWWATLLSQQRVLPCAHTQTKLRAELKSEQNSKLTSTLTTPSMYWKPLDLIPTSESYSWNCISSRWEPLAS